MGNKVKKVLSSEYLSDFYLKLKKIFLCSWDKVYFLIFCKWSCSQRYFDVAQRFGNQR